MISTNRKYQKSNKGSGGNNSKYFENTTYEYVFHWPVNWVGVPAVKAYGCGLKNIFSVSAVRFVIKLVLTPKELCSGHMHKS